MTRVAPELAVDDLAASLSHYEDSLGFRMVMMMPEGDHAIVERDDIALHLYRDDRRAQAQSIHVFVNGLDQLFAELAQKGARVTHGIARKPWGNREFRIADPSGNTIKFTEPVAELEG